MREVDPTSTTARFIAALEHYADEHRLGVDELRAIADTAQPLNPIVDPKRGIREHVAHGAFASLLKEGGIAWERVRDHAVAKAHALGAADVRKREIVDRTNWRFTPVADASGPVQAEPGVVRQFFLAQDGNGKPVVVVRATLSERHNFGTLYADGRRGKELGAMREVLDVSGGGTDPIRVISTYSGFHDRTLTVETIGGKKMPLDISTIRFENAPRGETAFIFKHGGNEHLLFGYGEKGTGIHWSLGARFTQLLPEYPGPTLFARAHDATRAYALSAVTGDNGTTLEIRDVMTNEIVDRVTAPSREPVAVRDLAMHEGPGGQRYVVARSKDGVTTAFDLKRGKQYALPKMERLRQTSPAFLENRDGSVTYFYSADSQDLSSITLPGGEMHKVKVKTRLDGQMMLEARELDDGRRVVVAYGDHRPLVLADPMNGIVTETPIPGYTPGGVFRMPDGRLLLATTHERREQVINGDDAVYHRLHYFQLYGPAK